MHLWHSLFYALLCSEHVHSFYILNATNGADLVEGASPAIGRRDPLYILKTASSPSKDNDNGAQTMKIERRWRHGESAKDRYARERSHVSRRYDIRRRTNNYHVVESDDPSTPNSAAIDQDGTDFSYIVKAGFGSKNKQMYMLVDSGAANTWVMAGDCKTKACNAHTTFGKGDSDTLKTETTPWSVSYGSGEVKGSIYNDTMSIAGLNVPMSFGAASQASDDFLQFPMDGILGLGRPASNDLEVPAFMDVLSQQKKLKSNVIGVNLQRSTDSATDGELTFGSWDQSKFDGGLTWIPSVSKDGVWKISIDDASINGKTLGFKGKNAIIDTGTSFILMPQNDAQKIHDSIPGSQQQSDSFEVPCASKATLEFALGGQKFQVSPKDYVGTQTSGGRCSSNILPQDYDGPDDWLLGDTFLKNVYTVFDFDQDRVGFGRRKQAGSSTSSSSAGASSSSSSPAAASSSSSSSSSPSPSSSSSSKGASSSPSATKASSSPSSSSPAKSSETSKSEDRKPLVPASPSSEKASVKSESPSSTSAGSAAASVTAKASTASCRLSSPGSFIFRNILASFALALLAAPLLTF